MKQDARTAQSSCRSTREGPGFNRGMNDEGPVRRLAGFAQTRRRDRLEEDHAPAHADSGERVGQEEGDAPHPQRPMPGAVGHRPTWGLKGIRDSRPRRRSPSGQEQGQSEDEDVDQDGADDQGEHGLGELSHHRMVTWNIFRPSCCPRYVIVIAVRGATPMS
jgi:hypothetical protein